MKTFQQVEIYCLIPSIIAWLVAPVEPWSLTHSLNDTPNRSFTEIDKIVTHSQLVLIALDCHVGSQTILNITAMHHTITNQSQPTHGMQLNTVIPVNIKFLNFGNKIIMWVDAIIFQPLK